MTDPKPARIGYGLLATASVLTFIPFIPLSLIGTVAGIAALVQAYRLRKNLDPLLANHGQWLVRTIWLSSAGLIFAVVIAGAVVSSNADHAAVNDLGRMITDGSGTPADIRASIDQFHATNGTLINTANYICFLLPVLYTLARLYKGFKALRAGRPVEPVTGWWL